MKMVRWPAMLLCLMMLLSACDTTPQTPVLTPAPTPVSYAPDSDSMALRTVPAVVYFLSDDLSRLVPTLRMVTVLAGETLAGALLTELLQEPEETGIHTIVTSTGMSSVLEIEQSRDVITVNLSGHFAQMEPFRQFAAKAAITNTLLEATEAQFVNVLVDGQEIPLHRLEVGGGIPTGSMSRYNEDLAIAWAGLQSEYNGLQEMAMPGDVQLRRHVTLYFASPDGTMLLPEVREISFTLWDMISPIIAELARGPGENSQRTRTLPADAALLGDPLFTYQYDGRSSVELNFSFSLRRFIEESGVEEALVYASIVRTITTALPQVTSVRLLVNGRKINYVQGYVMNEGEMKRSTFPVQVGGEISLYFPREDGRLRYVSRAIAQQDGISYRNWIRELSQGMRSEEGEDSLVIPYPEGFCGESIKGIVLNGDMAIINLTRQGAELFSGIDAQTERAMVYGIVNTFCSMPGVTRVLFLVEDTPVESLAGQICLLEPLLPNPGIVLYTKE